MMFPMNDEKAVPATITTATVDPPIAIRLDTDNGTQVNQLQQQKAKLKMTKYKTIAAVVLGLAFIIGAVLLAYLALSRGSAPQQQVFQFILRDSSSATPINLNVKVDKDQKVEYMTSPTVDKDNKRVGDVRGIRDGKSGFEAYTDKDGDKCLIGKITAQDKYGNYNNGSITERNVELNMTFYLLNQTIHPYVLGSLVGADVLEFCANRTAVWMIPYKYNSNVQLTNGREKRSYYFYYYYYRCFWNCNYYDGCYRQCYYYI